MKAFSKQLRQKFAVIRDLLQVLGTDTAVTLSKFEEELHNAGRSSADIAQLNFWLKASVRTFFAQVEGLSFAMRWFVVRAVEEGHIQLEPKVVAKLQERKYSRATGELGQPFRGSFDDNFKNAFRYFPRVFGCEWAPAFQGPGWDKFLKLLDARDDFTHPKDAAHLFQGSAGNYIPASVAWFTNTLNALLMDVGRRLGKELNLKEIEIQELSQDATSKLSLIKPPSSPEEIVPRETEFMALLKEDTEIAYKIFRDGFSLGSGAISVDEMSPLGIRLFVRSFFTEVEALGYMTHRILSDSASKEEISFTEEEVELLSTRELILKIAHFGEIFAQKFGQGLTIDQSGKAWEAFSQFAAFRDCITHPKDAKDLQLDLSKVETLGLVADSLGWFINFLEAVELSEKYVNLKVRSLNPLQS